MPSLENLSRQLLVLMGGPDNIISVTHCATRLRPVLKDRALVKTAEIDALDGVTGVVNKEAGLQIIIGTNVGEVYDAFMKVWQADDATSQKAETETSEVPSEKRSWFNGFVALVVSIFSPLLPLLAGAGLLRGFTILANEIGWLPTESSTNVLLTLAATSVFYFLPLLIAVTSAKRFATSPYIAMAIMGALIMPDFIGLVKGDGGNTITFLGIAIPVFNYTSQIIPAILTTWLQSKMELFMKKKIPNSLHMIVIPTVLLFVLVPVAAGIFGPLGNYLSIGIANGVGWLSNINQVITGAVVGGIWNILILFGVHWAPNTMVVIPEVAKTGHSAFIAYAANANFGMAGAAFAIFLKSRNRKLKNFSLTAITSVFLSGIVEPAIYGLGVKFKSPLVAGCLGAAIGGAFMGIFHVIGNAFVFGGLTTIPAFAGPTLWAYIVGLVISFVGGLAFTLLFGVKDPEAEMNQ
ncbi:EIIBCA-Bgl [Listeria grayi]|uniref:PTS system beta-glucoside-specific transporter subunit IIABC n=1 Tax=Listeria grayi FSL F6-1183 TaxID=1265827 RepID=A0A829R5R5_LISGR|nr:PTS transporter subunit EIIC [Listeria grayi]EUJ26527.1 PTS system beta-glucoside-specific transporter subunit IIABC [Listeria grayi FSL F6-1183]VEI36625.1 EIIBCA-Bgl [Listeria grayi]